MENKAPLGWIFLLTAAILAACGPSQAELDTQSTVIAANIFATQTAEAPTITPTLTLTPTETPTITPTYTVTPTPRPDFSGAVISPKDLPPGFTASSQDDLVEMGLAPGDLIGDNVIESSFALLEEAHYEVIIGFTTLIPTRLEQAEFDVLIPELSRLFLYGIGLALGSQDGEDMEFEDLAFIEDVGEVSAGNTVVTPAGLINYRWDVVVFRRGAAGAFVIVQYIDGDDPVVPVADVGRKLDSQLIEILGIFGCEDEIGCVDIAPDEPIHVSYMLPVTGSVQSLGISAKNAIELALEERGLIHGHDIELSGEDTHCSPEGGQTAAQKTAAYHSTIGVIGTTCSSAMVAAMSIISDSGLTIISPSNTSPMLTDPDQSWQAGYFRTGHNDKLQGTIAARFAYEELGARKAAAIHDGDPYAQGLVQAFADAFVDLGGTVTTIEAVNKGTTDMRPMLTTIGATAPDVLYFPTFQPEGDFITAQSIEVPGLENTALMSADGLMVASFAPSAGEAAIGMYLTGPYLSGPKSDAYLVDYTDHFGAPPQAPFSEHAYDAINILLDAIEKVAVVEDDGILHIGRQALRDAVAATSGYDGITGNLTCGPYGDCASGEALAIFQITSAQVDAEDNFPPPAIYTP